LREKATSAGFWSSVHVFLYLPVLGGLRAASCRSAGLHKRRVQDIFDLKSAFFGVRTEERINDYWYACIWGVEVEFFHFEIFWVRETSFPSRVSLVAELESGAALPGELDPTLLKSPRRNPIGTPVSLHR